MLLLHGTRCRRLRPFKSMLWINEGSFNQYIYVWSNMKCVRKFFFGCCERQLVLDREAGLQINQKKVEGTCLKTVWIRPELIETKKAKHLDIWFFSLHCPEFWLNLKPCTRLLFWILVKIKISKNKSDSTESVIFSLKSSLFVVSGVMLWYPT